MAVTAPHRFVTTLQERLSELESEFHRAYWDSQVEANAVNERRRADLELELRRLKGDPEALEVVTHALGEDVHERVLRRQLEVLRLSLTGNQMDEEQRLEMVTLSTAVESDFAAYRPEVDGRRLTENEVDAILKESSDEAERRRAWEASKEIGGVVAGRVRELARLRNQVARDLGFADYYRMSLSLQELPEVWLFDLLDELDELSAAPFEAWKHRLDDELRARFGVDELLPWHYADPFFQSLPPAGRVGLDGVLSGKSAGALATETFAAWGIDITKVIDASDLYPRERKCQHAFCLDVDRSGRDVRILANVVPGERWVEVMLHESGHAAYDVCIDDKLPYLLHRPAHIFVTEAAAILSGRLVRDPAWLTTVAGVDRAEVEALAPRLRDASAAQMLLFARWGLVMTHFERELYSDPEADLDARWWDLVERFQLLRRPPGRSAPDWAAKIHVAVAPVYYQNYLLGEMLASQLRATCEDRFGGLVGVAEAGSFLVGEVFRPGALLRWDELVEKATGGPLSARAFAADATA
ncbi:MAG TPA: M2 family metallopeptidase [Actinomycetota bacterium]|nr:M2 family metallopeptidase [Actinomycetota bacterium]